MGLLKNISHHIKQSNKPWSFFAESIGIHKDDIENIGKTENPDKEFVHALTRKIWSEILEVGDIKYQDYSHYTQISSITQFATFLSGSTDAANGIETKASAGDKVTKFSSCGTDAANGTETKVANVEKVEDDIGGGHGTIQDSEEYKEKLRINKENVNENKGKSTNDKKENLRTLAEVVRTDDFHLLRQFCDAHNIDIATRYDGVNDKLLHSAIEQNAVNILQMLMLRYSQGGYRERPSTPLDMAVTKGNLDVFKIMLKNSKDINTGWLLHHAVENNKIDVVKYLIANQADINALNKRTETPLHSAIYENYVEIVSYLVNNGAAINSRDVPNDSKGKPPPPLILAAILERFDIMKILVDSGADINIRDNGDTALHKSLQWNKIKACEFLCDNGIDVDAYNRLKETALHIAVKEGDLDICKLLCYQGANINIKAFRKKSALEVASYCGNEEILNFFKHFVSDQYRH